MALREKVTEAMAKGTMINQPFDKDHPYHHKAYQDNLFYVMGEQALSAYGAGSGSELKGYVRNGKNCPAKMSSIASSSAMTFNLLGNGPAFIKLGSDLPIDAYQVQYEKQMRTLDMRSNPANLDAFLSNGSDKKAIFCEMKLLEWLGKSGELKPNYEKAENYFDKDAFPVFKEVIDQIKDKKFQRYDAWQMFKHMLAIYNHTSFTTAKSLEKFPRYPSMAGQYKDIWLANVVNEFPADRIENEEVREDYIKDLKKEQDEANTFINIIQGSGIPGLFKRNCNADFHVTYLSAEKFAETLMLSDSQRDYLKRYF